MFESIQDIQHKIETVSSLVEESTGDAKTHLEDSILSLYEEKYDAIQDAKRKVESLYESGSITEEEYEEANSYLTERRMAISSPT